ncbi:MAG: adenylate/guanylate cyclase domain-containing protein, partial [Nitrososphaerales archaeon]
MSSAKIQTQKSQIKRLEAELKALQKYVPSIVRRAIAKDPQKPPLDRQMRDLTVLFMDIAGCTRLCELLSPRRMQMLIQEYFSSFIDEVYELGGTINETAGDGLMMLFLNEEPEDHAWSAARAASLIHAHTKEFAICWGGECRDIAVHIGINSGRASLGVMEFRGKHEIRATYTASGPVINVAARLANLAPGGKTYVGEESWRRIKQTFNGSLVGRVELKNVGPRGEVYEVRR